MARSSVLQVGEVDLIGLEDHAQLGNRIPNHRYGVRLRNTPTLRSNMRPPQEENVNGERTIAEAVEVALPPAAKSGRQRAGESGHLRRADAHLREGREGIGEKIASYLQAQDAAGPTGDVIPRQGAWMEWIGRAIGDGDAKHP